MIYKIEKGMEIDFFRKNKITNEKEVRTFIIKDVPDDHREKITLIDKKNGKIKKISFEAIKTAKRHVFEKEKHISALSTAIQILEEEDRPIHIDELIKLVFNKGYVIPRNGKTFKNTISTSLNNECTKYNARIKKVYFGVYAAINCDKPYVKKYSDTVKKEFHSLFD